MGNTTVFGYAPTNDNGGFGNRFFVEDKMELIE
jgi:hypothetical protein